MSADELLAREFVPFGDVLAARALEQPDRPAISDASGGLTWHEFGDRIERIGAQLQAGGVRPGDTVAIAGHNAVGYALVYCAAIRIGAVAAVLTASATPTAIAAMLADCGARYLFLDAAMGKRLASVPMPGHIKRIAFDDSDAGIALDAWMAEEGARTKPVEIGHGDPFNIIYSSGTTGAPKGIVQSHGLRMAHIRRWLTVGYDPTAVTIISTALYSNTTLVSFIPALAGGGRVLLMPKFDARAFCDLAARARATHAMLVPVQYQRILALPDFDSLDLSSFRFKGCTSAPFSAALKAEVLRRWPGRLLEVYGMTEGGGTCILDAQEFPHKLHTVGRPAAGHDIRLIDEHGREVEPGGVGEVVGRSPTMMIGYHGLPAATREVEWFDTEGRRFIRHGDVGRFDEDGFLVLMDRTKDLIISGGFNIYPSDLEAELLKHPAVAEVAVVGVASRQWGETPAAFVVLRDPGADPEAILDATNARLAATQRISEIYSAAELPRSASGKVLKRELRDRLARGTDRALRHVLLAERTASQLDDVPPDTPLVPVTRVGILGAGTMGAGIAMNFLSAGMPVVLVDREQAALDRGVRAIGENYERAVRKGRIRSADIEKAMRLLAPTVDDGNLADCDLVIEAVFELLEIKKAAFRRLDQIVKAGAILATNTSYLDVNVIAAETKRPEWVIGLHFFSPANIMKLLEIVRGAKTSPTVLATSMALAEKIGKVAVVAGVCHGFIGNRMLAPRQREATALLLEGARPQQIDRVLVDFGFPMGPFAMSDLAGLDIGWDPARSAGSTIREVLCERGRLGRKRGRGYYDYDKDNRATPSAEVEEIIDRFARNSGRPRRTIGDDEIRERLLYPLVNEGAHILQEGVARRASDIDVVWINGYAWPSATGGPMFWADMIGLDTVVAGLQQHAPHLDDFKLSHLLQRKALRGERFHDRGWMTG